jgi:hypothetical protein
MLHCYCPSRETQANHREDSQLILLTSVSSDRSRVSLDTIQHLTMSTDPDSKTEPMAPPAPKSNDFVIRDGFPALRNEQGEPLIKGDEPLPRAPFLSYTSALDLADTQTTMEEDCATVFSARAKEGQAAYSAGCTYFAPAVMKPRCGLEALALQIFEAHTKDLPKGSFAPEQSGAEWWTLVLDADPPKEESENGDDDDDESKEEDHDEVGMHFDADYGLEDQAPGLMLHPRVATITYLSNVGAPTLILDKRSPPPNDVMELGGEITRGWLSGPRIGKHVAFDGRLLHGAPATFFPGVALGDVVVEAPPAKKQKSNDGVASIPRPEKPPQRITFMVNVWLNHCPMDAELLDDDIVEKLKTPSDNKSNLSLAKTTQDSPLDQKSVGVYTEDPAGEEETVICDRVVTLFYNEKMEKQHAISQAAARDGKSYELQFAKGSLRLEVGAVVEEKDEEE